MDTEWGGFRSGVEVCAAPVLLQWDELARSPATNGEDQPLRTVPCCAPLLVVRARHKKMKKEADWKTNRERKRERETAAADNLLRQLHRHWHRCGAIGSAIGTATIIVRVVSSSRTALTRFHAER